jgi:hypothetical protein
MNSYMLPVFMPFSGEWYVQNEDGTFSTITGEEYRNSFQNKIRFRG